MVKHFIISTNSIKEVYLESIIIQVPDPEIINIQKGNNE